MGAPSCSNDAPTPQLVPSSHPVPVGHRPGRGDCKRIRRCRRLLSRLELFRHDIGVPARADAADLTRPSTQDRPPPRRPLSAWAMPAEGPRSTATSAPGQPQPPLDRLGRRITPSGPCTEGQIRLLGGPCAPRLPNSLANSGIPEVHEPGWHQATLASLVGRPLHVPAERQPLGLCTSSSRRRF